MPTTTPQQSFPVPVQTDDPNIPDDMMALAVAIEKRVIGVYNNVTDRDAKVSSPQEGQYAHTKDTDTLWYYNGSGWTALMGSEREITSGASVPPNSSGNDGDVFFKTS